MSGTDAKMQNTFLDLETTAVSELQELRSYIVRLTTAPTNQGTEFGEEVESNLQHLIRVGATFKAHSNRIIVEVSSLYEDSVQSGVGYERRLRTYLDSLFHQNLSFREFVLPLINRGNGKLRIYGQLICPFTRAREQHLPEEIKAQLPHTDHGQGFQMQMCIAISLTNENLGTRIYDNTSRRADVIYTADTRAFAYDTFLPHGGPSSRTNFTEDVIVGPRYFQVNRFFIILMSDISPTQKLAHSIERKMIRDNNLTSSIGWECPWRCTCGSGYNNLVHVNYGSSQSGLTYAKCNNCGREMEDGEVDDEYNSSDYEKEE